MRSRKVIVKGPRGTLSRTFKHLAVDIQMEGKRKIKVIKWFGKRKELAAVHTVCSHIENMFKGVRKVTLFINHLKRDTLDHRLYLYLILKTAH